MSVDKVEWRAQLLQEGLHGFAQQGYHRQRELLANGILSTFKGLLIPEASEVVNFLGQKNNIRGGNRFMNILYKTINAAAQTAFERPDGSIVDKPFTGGHTLVILDHIGNLHGGSSQPIGEVYSLYSKGGLYPYALAKAVLRLHLVQAGKGGIEDNWFDLLKTLPKDYGLYQGDSNIGLRVDGEFLHNIHEEAIVSLIIGASGCELSEEYHRELTPPKLPTEFLINDRAGEADTIFANRVGELLRHYDAKTLIPEPVSFSHARTVN